MRFAGLLSATNGLSFRTCMYAQSSQLFAMISTRCIHKGFVMCIMPAFTADL